MKYSKLFGKTVKSVSKNIALKSHALLVKGGFIRESVAGRYYFLPLGMRVKNKIVKVVREEMNKAGAQEMITPVLHPLDLWKETNRTNEAGFELMQIKDRRGAEFALGGTAEEMMVDLVRKFQISYKELPFNIYQFSQKFRDELRARGGLLRAREFLMKDAYSFHIDEEDFKKEYQNMWDTYVRIFNRLGLEVKAVESDGGYIGGDYCHEFVVEHESGESNYLETEDGSYCAHEDVANFVHENKNPDEEVKDFEIIDQPEWVKTMEENVKHYGEPEWRYLKNVVYRTGKGDLVIVGIRGDLEVNPVKVQKLLGEGVELVEASDDDLAAMGTKSGYVHSWGEKIEDINKSEGLSGKVIYVADASLKTVKNFIGGQKEDTTDSHNVNYGRDFKHEVEGDVAMAKAGFLDPDGKQRLVEGKGVEVGNIFQLGHHYTKKMKGASFVNSDGAMKEYYMGCYGIGIGRTMQTIVEILADDRGIVWPEEIAPYQVALINIGNDEMANELYKKLIDSGIEVLWDDRDNVSPGAKFMDSDLIGCPVRLVISERNGEKVEWKKRESKDVETLNVEEVINKLK